MQDAVARLTPLGIIVLGLLAEGDMHPYEMIRLLRARREDRLVTITNGTVYHTVARLERAALLAEVGVDRDGNRPERTTYTVTDAGTAAATEWVRRGLSRIDRPGEFRVALAEAHNLPRHEVADLLRARRARLAGSLDAHDTGYALAIEKGIPLQYLIELDRERALLACDLAWLDTLLHRLDADRIPWGFLSPPSERYLEQRKAARE